MDLQYEDYARRLLHNYVGITNTTMIEMILDDMHQINLIYPIYTDPRRKGRPHIGFMMRKVLLRHRLIETQSSFGIIRTPEILEEHVSILKLIFKRLEWRWPIDISM